MRQWGCFTVPHVFVSNVNYCKVFLPVFHLFFLEELCYDDSAFSFDFGLIITKMGCDDIILAVGFHFSHISSVIGHFNRV